MVNVRARSVDDYVIFHFYSKRMPLFCWCGQLSKKNRESITKKMDFRKADPTYVNFEPKTCAEAIDLFCRHKKLGLQCDLYPECFVHCARSLPDDELDKFHCYIVAPGGDLSKGGEKPTLIDDALEKERLLLLREAEKRDMPALDEDEKREPSEAVCDEEDEKREPSSDESLLIIKTAE